MVAALRDLDRLRHLWQRAGAAAGGPVGGGGCVATTPQDTPVRVPVLANDLGAGLSVTAVTQPQHGLAATINADGTVSYSPAVGFVGIDSFSYTITDKNGLTSSASVTVVVTPRAPPVLLGRLLLPGRLILLEQPAPVDGAPRAEERPYTIGEADVSTMSGPSMAGSQECSRKSKTGDGR